MKITMLVTNAYHPDPRVHKEAVYLVSQGHHVTVMCWDRHQEYLDQADAMIDGVRVIRVPFGSKLGSGLKQLPAYIKFILACGAWMRDNPADAVHAHDLDGMLVAVLNRKRSIPIVFDMHEYYEYTTRTTRLTRPMIRWLVDRMAKAAKAIVYVHPVQLDHLSDAERAKAFHIPNYPQDAMYLPIDKTPSKTIRIGYIGKIRQYEQLKNVIDAARDLPVQLHFHGDGVDYDRVKAASEGHPNVIMTGRFSSRDVGELYRNVDLMVVVYDTATFQYQLVEPVKFYEAILTQTPVLVERSMEIAQWVIHEGVGFAVDGKSVESIRTVLIELIAHPEKVVEAKTKLAPFSVRFRWQDVVKQLDQIYSERA
jgi:glycosyltransferase involved in cell wall biosynthesis